MNQEQITSIIRQILLTVGGGLVTKGYIDDGTLTSIVGGLIAAGAAAWALYTRRDHGLIASAAEVSSVATITTTKASTANAIPSPKVVAAR